VIHLTTFRNVSEAEDRLKSAVAAEARILDTDVAGVMMGAIFMKMKLLMHKAYNG
jgi:hypothetical protein